jgi:hypothetical protein
MLLLSSATTGIYSSRAVVDILLGIVPIGGCQGGIRRPGSEAGIGVSGLWDPG